MSQVRVELRGAGVKELLAGSRLESNLRARGERVADAGRARGIRVEGTPGRIDLPIDVTSSGGGGKRIRVRVRIVHPAGLAVEAKHRLLGASLDAAK